eukprot:222264_1
MLVKPLTEQKINSIPELQSQDNELKRITTCVNLLVNKLIECGTEITNVSELYKQLNISPLDLYSYKWIKIIVNHCDLFVNTAYCKSSKVIRNKVIHIYYNVFERLLFELDLFHLFFAYDVYIDNHSPWDNLNPSSIFILVGNLQKLYEQSQPTQHEINTFFSKSQRFIPVLKYKYVNSNNWKQFENFVNVNADINNDYNYSARILHPQLFDDEIKDEFEIFENNNNNYNNYANSHNRNSSQILDEVEKQNNIDNHFSYEILLMDKENNNSLLLVHSDTVRDTFNCNTNEELSRNMTCPSLYLSSNHVLSARKWIPDSDLYGTIMIKCHHTIMIMKNGCINGNGSGYTSHYGLGHGLYYKEPNKLNQGNKYYSGGGYGSSGIKAHNPLALGGKCYGDKYLANVSHFGSPSGGRERGGGIIQLIAKYIINYGKICCDGDSGKQFGGGSGGSIKLVCQKFINYGKITCCGGKGGTYERKFQNNTALRVGGDGGNGRIAIYCQQYINKGQIIPNPTVIQDKEKFIFSSDIQFTPLALGKDNQFYV